MNQRKGRMRKQSILWASYPSRGTWHGKQLKRGIMIIGCTGGIWVTVIQYNEGNCFDPTQVSLTLDITREVPDLRNWGRLTHRVTHRICLITPCVIGHDYSLILIKESITLCNRCPLLQPCGGLDCNTLFLQTCLQKCIILQDDFLLSRSRIDWLISDHSSVWQRYACGFPFSSRNPVSMFNMWEQIFGGFANSFSIKYFSIKSVLKSIHNYS